MAEMGDNLDGASRGQAETAVAELKSAMEGEDAARMRQLTEQLTQIAHTMAQAAYSRNQNQQAGPQTNQGANPASGDDDVVDADFEEVA